MMRYRFIALLFMLLSAGAFAADLEVCRDESWQPTFVTDAVSGDPTPYYAMPDGSFTALTGDWQNQSGPGLCALYGVRDKQRFSDCLHYQSVQCSCDAESSGNETCRRFFNYKGAKSVTGGGRSDSWSTTQGDMLFLADPKGGHLAEYGSDNGRIIGDYRAGFLEGYWVEDDSMHKCDSQKDGSYHWGRIIFGFDDARTTFNGYWGYCNEQPDNKWKGKK